MHRAAIRHRQPVMRTTAGRALIALARAHSAGVPVDVRDEQHRDYGLLRFDADGSHRFDVAVETGDDEDRASALQTITECLDELAAFLLIRFAVQLGALELDDAVGEPTRPGLPPDAGTPDLRQSSPRRAAATLVSAPSAPPSAAFSAA